MRENLSKDPREKELKPLLKHLGIRQLKHLCDEIGIKKPRAYEKEGFLSSETILPSKSSYIRKIIKSDIDENLIKSSTAKFLGLPSSAPTSAIVQKADEVKEKEIMKTQSEESQELGIISDALTREYQKMIRDMQFGDEAEFRNGLVTFLKTKFTDMNIQDVSKQPHQGDISINKNYVIEAKYAKGSSTMNKGLEELKTYASQGKGTLVAILDIGLMPNAEIEKYEAFYEQDGAKVVRVIAKPKKKSSKGTTITTVVK